MPDASERGAAHRPSGRGLTADERNVLVVTAHVEISSDATAGEVGEVTRVLAGYGIDAAVGAVGLVHGLGTVYIETDVFAFLTTLRGVRDAVPGRGLGSLVRDLRRARRRESEGGPEPRGLQLVDRAGDLWIDVPLNLEESHYIGLEQANLAEWRGSGRSGRSGRVSFDEQTQTWMRFEDYLRMQRDPMRAADQQGGGQADREGRT